MEEEETAQETRKRHDWMRIALVIVASIALMAVITTVALAVSGSWDGKTSVARSGSGYGSSGGVNCGQGSRGRQVKGAGECDGDCEDGSSGACGSESGACDSGECNGSAGSGQCAGTCPTQ